MFPNESHLALMFQTAGTDAVNAFMATVEDMGHRRLHELNPSHLPPNRINPEVLMTHALVPGEQVNELHAALGDMSETLGAAHAEIIRLRDELRLAQQHVEQLQAEVAARTAPAPAPGKAPKGK